MDTGAKLVGERGRGRIASAIGLPFFVKPIIGLDSKPDAGIKAGTVDLRAYLETLPVATVSRRAILPVMSSRKIFRKREKIR